MQRWHKKTRYSADYKKTRYSADYIDIYVVLMVGGNTKKSNNGDSWVTYLCLCPALPDLHGYLVTIPASWDGHVSFLWGLSWRWWSNGRCSTGCSHMLTSESSEYWTNMGYYHCFFHEKIYNLNDINVLHNEIFFINISKYNYF